MRIRNTGYNVLYGMGSYLDIDAKHFAIQNPLLYKTLPYQMKTFCKIQQELQ